MSRGTDTPTTRRSLLSSLSAIGITSAFFGGGTMAYLSDPESTTRNTFAAGELDLRLAWNVYYNGELLEQVPVGGLPSDPTRVDYHQGPGPVLSFADVKPGDHGRVVFCFEIFDNLGWVWFRSHISDYRENGLSEPEAQVDTTPHEGELQKYLQTRFWYDSGDGDIDAGEPLLAGEIEDGVLLDAEPTPPSDSTCIPLGKVEYDDSSEEFVVAEGAGRITDTNPPTFEFTRDATTTEIVLTNRYYEDDDLVGFDFTVTKGPGLCAVSVKGGPSSTDNRYACATGGESLFTPEFPKHRSRTHYGLSHISFSRCTQQPDKVHFTPGTPHCVGLEWWLPKTTGNDIQTDSLLLDLSFLAQQYRHNQTPSNPWSR